MGRGIVAAVALVAATVVAPATAAPSPYVVYEIARVRAGGPETVEVTLRSHDPSPNTVRMLVGLLPENDTYRRAFVLFTTVGTWGGHHTYGGPTAVPCAVVCAARKPSVELESWQIRPRPGQRLLAAGQRGSLEVWTDSAYWRVREVPLGVRTVTADRADATGYAAGPASAEHFRGASAPGGAYGSLAVATPPCVLSGVGSVTLRAPDGLEEGMFCGPTAPSSLAAETGRGGTWRVTGNVVGQFSSTVRLTVLDYPRVPRR